MQSHALIVWRDYVLESGFSKLLVIAHSAGGSCLNSIILKNQKTFNKQVKSIAYTDSSPFKKEDLNTLYADYLFDHAKHYKASDLPVGEYLEQESAHSSCVVVSAGHNTHAYTTGCAWPKIKEQFEEATR